MEGSKVSPVQAFNQEDSAARAKRLAALVRVRLKESMAQSAGPEALLYWLYADGAKSS